MNGDGGDDGPSRRPSSRYKNMVLPSSFSLSKSWGMCASVIHGGLNSKNSTITYRSVVLPRGWVTPSCFTGTRALTGPYSSDQMGLCEVMRFIVPYCPSLRFLAIDSSYASRRLFEARRRVLCWPFLASELGNWFILFVLWMHLLRDF